ncbi:MAG: alanine racemase [Alphaproteobacteria bacterium]
MGTLTISCAAIARNYKQIQDMAGADCAAAAVVKANAYGLGVAPVATALQKAGADRFFIATLAEALELRTIVGAKPDIYMLHGFEEAGCDLYKAEAITPVLNSVHEIESYAAFAARGESLLPAIIHIDTGMNRLGLKQQDLEKAASKLGGIDLRYVMSHFACADEKNHPMNDVQYKAFKTAAEMFPGARKTLANSAGIFRSPDYHFDMIRPGMSLYGLNPKPEAENPMDPVIELAVEVLQVKDAAGGEVCGYNATHRFEKEQRLAIVSMGYADGFPRSLSNTGALYWKGHKCPLRGRVSMDLTTVDLSAVPENDLPGSGDMLEVIGPSQSADDLAAAAGTIGYEILTSLSRRYQRIYKN